MKITNKTESYSYIKKLNLNRFPEKIFKQGQTQEIQDFITKYPAEYYAVRDKSKAGGIFKLKVKKSDVLYEVLGYELFSINVSSYNYAQNQLLVGEMLVSNNTISATLSTNSTFSVRDALKFPDYNFCVSIFNNKILNSIPHFNDIYNYIVAHNLQDVIVEFAYFNIPLGTNADNIVVYELRTHY